MLWNFSNFVVVVGSVASLHLTLSNERALHLFGTNTQSISSGSWPSAVTVAAAFLYDFDKKNSFHRILCSFHWTFTYLIFFFLFLHPIEADILFNFPTPCTADFLFNFLLLSCVFSFLFFDIFYLSIWGNNDTIVTMSHAQLNFPLNGITAAPKFKKNSNQN